MSALEHYAAPSHVAPSGGFATGDASKEDTGKENRDRYHWNEWDLTQGGGWLKDWLELNICLLYTSPSPRDRTRSRMPSSA